MGHSIRVPLVAYDINRTGNAASCLGRCKHSSGQVYFVQFLALQKILSLTLSPPEVQYPQLPLDILIIKEGTL